MIALSSLNTNDQIDSDSTSLAKSFSASKQLHPLPVESRLDPDEKTEAEDTTTDNKNNKRDMKYTSPTKFTKMTMHSNSSELRKSSDPSSLNSNNLCAQTYITTNNSGSTGKLEGGAGAEDYYDATSILSSSRRVSPFPNKFEKRRRRSRQKFTPRSIQLLTQQRKMISRCLSLPTLASNKNSSDRNRSLINGSPTIKLLIGKASNKKYNSKNDSYTKLSSYSLSSLLQNRNMARSNHFELSSSLKLKTKSRHLFDEVNPKSNTANNLASTLKKTYQVVGNFSMLAYKRSFSVNDLNSNQTYIRKSSSFDKFLQNVMKGKQKSLSLCNFNSSNTNLKEAQTKQDQTAIYNGANGYLHHKSDGILNHSRSPTQSKSSDESNDTLEKMMMLIMNSTSRSTWPVLKIEDSIKGSTNNLEIYTSLSRLGRSSSHINSSSQNLTQDTFDSMVMNANRGMETVTQLKPPTIQLDPNYTVEEEEDQSQKSDIYIPSNVREALQCAGINIEQIIKLTNKLENTMNNGEGMSDEANVNGDVMRVTKKVETLQKDMSNEDVRSVRSVNSNALASDDEKDKVAAVSKSKVVSVSNKALVVMQNISATNNFSVSRKNESDVLSSKASESEDFSREPISVEIPNDTGSQTSDQFSPPAVKPRRRASKIRYATIGNFSLPNTIKSSHSSDNETHRMSHPPDLYCGGSDIESSSYSINSSMSTNKIQPAKFIVSQFKPTVHKRSCTAPITLSLSYLINSASNDSFLMAPIETNPVIPDRPLNNIKAIKPKHSPIEEISITDELTNNNTETDANSNSHDDNKTIPNSPKDVDLTKSLPNHAKKKASVTRSFSYTIGNLTGARQHSQHLKANRKSDKTIENSAIKPNRSSFSNISSALGLSSKSNGSSIKSSRPKKRPSLVREDVGNDMDENPHQQGQDSSAIVSLALKKPAHLLLDANDVDAAPIFKTGKEELQNIYDFQHAKRKAIVVQMYDTEKSYVEALKILVTKYYLPLKEKDVVDRNQINDIFYKIPEIHVHHELLLSSLKSKFDTWDTRQTIGDLLLNIFAKQSVIETYISFVNNYHISQEAIRICKEQSNLFSKFVEQQTKEHRGKLTLKDLIIQPVQRIPRYELYIKDFLKCTPSNHADYQLLTKASVELHNLAEKIDQVHKELHESYGTDSQSVLQIIQDAIENLDDLVNAYRYYIRHDMITIISPQGVKKDRCLFLFSDLIIITSCKRRSGNINKRHNSIILTSPIGKQYLESIKYKFIVKFQLEDIELTGSALLKKLSIERDFLEADLNTITRISELAKNVVYPHHILDESIKEVTTGILRQLNETSNRSIVTSSTDANSTNVNSNSSSTNTNSVNDSNTGDQVNSHPVTAKNSIVESMTPIGNDANKQPLNRSVLTLNTLERVETMTVVFGHADQRLSWEKCFVEAKKVFFESSSRKPATFLNVIAIPRNRSGVQFTCASARSHLTSSPNDVWICSTDGQMGQVCIMNTFPDLTVSSCNTVCNSRIMCIQCVPPYRLKRITKQKSVHTSYASDTTANNASAERDQEANEFQYDMTGCDTAAATFAKNRQLMQELSDRLDPESLLNYDSSDEDESGSHSANEEPAAEATASGHDIPLLVNDAASSQDNTHSTMWIGNEDGSLHIYQFSDSAIRTVSRKSRVTKQFSSCVISLAYIDNKVFVSLKNGELAIFRRHFSIWNYDNYTVTSIAQSPFNCMLTVAGKLWCSSSNKIIVLSPTLVTIDHHFSVDGDQNVLLATGASSSWAVWVAGQKSLDLKLYHATKYTLLAEINIKQSVSQKLAGLEELVKLHKLACLRITCLYVCKDTLWVGTSAGLICNVKTPHITNTTTKLSTPLSLNVLSQGNFGPVRFITSVEIAKNPPQQQTAEHADSVAYKTVVVSGGEGYEEYKYASASSLPIGNIASSGSQDRSQHASFDLTGGGQSNSNSASGASSLSPNTCNNLAVGGSLQPHVASASSVIAEDSLLGRDDLINYVLTWDI